MSTLGDAVASALARTAEEAGPGAGRKQVRRSSIHLDHIQKRLSGVLPRGEEIAIAIRIVFVERDQGGASVTASKRRGGLIAVGSTTFLLAHEMSMARYSTTMYFSSSVTAAPIEVVTADGPTPGLRVTLPDMSGVALGLEPVPGADTARLVAIRDRIVGALGPPGTAGPSLARSTLEVPPGVAQAAAKAAITAASQSPPPPGLIGRSETGIALVFSFAGELLSSAAAGASTVGDAGAFWQIFDPAPEDRSGQMEIYEQRLSFGDSRAFVGSRLAGGFRGVAGFSCLEDTRPHLLRVEAFDSRDGASVAMSVAVRRTLFGRYRPCAAPRFHGEAEPLSA